MRAEASSHAASSAGGLPSSAPTAAAYCSVRLAPAFVYALLSAWSAYSSGGMTFLRLSGAPGAAPTLSSASLLIQNCAMPLSSGHAVASSQPPESSCEARQYCQRAKAMSPLMWISRSPVAAQLGHTSSPVSALSQGNIDPPKGGV